MCHIPIQLTSPKLSLVSAFSLAKVLFCILGFLSIIDGSIVKTLPDPGMCVEGKNKINDGSFNPCFCLHSWRSLFVQGFQHFHECS